jgi:hypothetical protein
VAYRKGCGDITLRELVDEGSRPALLTRQSSSG